MFCKYCGKQIKEGEVCACRKQQNNNQVNMHAPGRADNQAKQQNQAGKGQRPAAARPVKPQRPQPQRPQPQVSRSTSGGGKGMLAASFVCSALSLLSFVLLRFLFADSLAESDVLGDIYPYLMYMLPLMFGAIALILAIFSMQNKRIRTGSIVAILVSVLFMAGIFGAMFAFPYEPSYGYEDDEDDRDRDRDKDDDDADEEKDRDKDKKGSASKKADEDDKESESEVDELVKEYDKGSLDYIEAKNKLADLDIEDRDDKEAEKVFDFQERIESDLEKQMENFAENSDYKSILQNISRMQEEADEEDDFLYELQEAYETAYIDYLNEQSVRLVDEGRKDDAVRMLEEAQPLVEDKNAIGDMLRYVQKSVGNGDYVIPGSDTRYLTSSEISGLSIQQVNYAKNEIYARHGRRFQSNELQNYFNSKSWYHGTVDPSAFNSGVLNVYEKKNIELLSNREFSMESGGYKLDR